MANKSSPIWLIIILCAIIIGLVLLVKNNQYTKTVNLLNEQILKLSQEIDNLKQTKNQKLEPIASSSASPLVSPEAENTIKTENECLKIGGEWRKAGMGLYNICFIKMKDFGKTCLSTNDCEGSCLAPEDTKPGESVAGKCSEYNLLFGCHSSVDNGKATAVICVD